MWLYHQATGLLELDGGGATWWCYSGKGIHKNNPGSESLKDLGPIPQGRYQIQPPVDTVTHGPYVLPLIPDAANQMYGRSGFLIHGDSVVDPGNASEGCIVTLAGRPARENVWNSDNHQLEVT